MSPAAHDDGPWAWVFTPRRPNEKRYWLVKSEPDVFSFDDLRAAPKQTTPWDGVRNFAARNFLRDGMKRGDQVFFYHSSTNPQAIVGICQVAREAYPDPTALDRKHPAFDAKSDPKDPSWFAVDLQAVALEFGVEQIRLLQHLQIDIAKLELFIDGRWRGFHGRSLLLR